MPFSEDQPLVSICIPVYNGGDLVEHALLSAIHQTYQNLEIVVADNASTDNTEAVVRGFAAKDPRIKYFRHSENIGPTKNFLKVLELATGTYAQLLGHDDWLSRNYVEESMRQLRLRPEADIVVPETISLKLRKDHSFNFIRRSSVPIGVRSSGQIASTIYSSEVGSMIIYAMVPRATLLEAANFTLSVFNDKSNPVSKEFREFHNKGFGIDITITLRTLAKTRAVIFTNKLAYMKIDQPAAGGRSAGPTVETDHAAGVLNNYHYFRICHDYLYDRELSKYKLGMRVTIAVEAVNSVAINYVKNSFSKKYFQNFGWRNVRSFFELYSRIEMMMVFLALPMDLIKRLWLAIARMLKPREASLKGECYFLDVQGRFHS
jgi:glycosyltransferase involved in cell wall biosynthesis